MFSRMHKVAHSEEVNWASWSDVMTTGIPNLLTHPCNKTFAQSTAVVVAICMASGHREVLSMIVNRWKKS
jgi:hypothetical protein